MPLALVVTDAGRAAIVNAQNTGTAPVTVAQLGVSATAVVAAAGMTALAGEIKRLATIGGSAVADDTIHLVAKDESADAYSLRSFALYLADGTLFALYGQAAPILEKTASVIAFLQNDIKLSDIAAASITFGDLEFINPPATETVKGVAEIATQAETDTGTDDTRIVSPKKFKAGLLAWAASFLSDIWRASNDGSGSGLDADLLDGQQGSWYSNIVARLGYTPANKAGDVFTGNIIVSHILDIITHFIAEPLKSAYIRFQRGASVRWDMGMNSTAETGGNAGSNFFINRYSDLGAYIDTPFAIDRSTGQLSAKGSVVWSANNDGAGSGLDADLLDGQDGSYYVNIPARLGYMPLNAATYTAADILAKIASVDGSGSGLDADLLDGINSTGFIKAGTSVWHSSTDGAPRFNFETNGATYFGTNGGWIFQYGGINRIAFGNDGSASFKGGITSSAAVSASDGGGQAVLAPNGDIYAQREGGATGAVFFGAGIGGARYLFFDGAQFNLVGGPLYINSALAWNSVNDGAGSGLDADLLDGQDGSFYANIPARLGYTPLNAASYTAPDVLTKMVSVDGSGSGLDADMLDGKHASQFVEITASSIVANGGYRVYADGLKECWGYVDVPQDGYAVFNLPVAHVSWVIPVVSAYTPGGFTESFHNADFNSILTDGSGHPVGIRFWNADDRTVRIHVHTKGY